MSKNLIGIIFLGWVLLSLYPIHHVDPKLESLNNEFMTIIKDCKAINYPNHTKIVFESLKYPMAGYCKLGVWDWKIVIDPIIYDRYSPSLRKQLLFHELTHCLLQYGHNDDYNNYMYPDINPDIPEEDVYTQLNVYMKELCG